jgi:glycosyltransferase involved in cell wall biosynthesis
LKILVAGNLIFAYGLVSLFRKQGIEAKLLLQKFPAQIDDPKFMYPELEKEHSDCVIRYDNHDRNFSSSNWKFQIIREMRRGKYDIIIAMTEFPIFAMFSSKPFIIISTGPDIRELLFKKSLKGKLLRLSYKLSKKILWSQPDSWPLLEKLKISKKLIFLDLPIRPNIFAQKFDKGRLKDKFIIFHPTSQIWKVKGNEKFLFAYNRLCKVRDDVHLIMPNKGSDIEKARSILLNGPARDKFELVPMMDTEKLQFYYNLSDLVVDQFVLGSFGMIIREAMNCAKPVLAKINESLCSKFYGNLPEGIINVSTEDEIYQQLIRLASDKEISAYLGNQNKKWFEEHFGEDVLAQKYIDICKNLL